MNLALPADRTCSPSFSDSWSSPRIGIVHATKPMDAEEVEAVLLAPLVLLRPIFHSETPPHLSDAGSNTFRSLFWL